MTAHVLAFCAWGIYEILVTSCVMVLCPWEIHIIFEIQTFLIVQRQVWQLMFPLDTGLDPEEKCEFCLLSVVFCHVQCFCHSVTNGRVFYFSHYTVRGEQPNGLRLSVFWCNFLFMPGVCSSEKFLSWKVGTFKWCSPTVQHHSLFYLEIPPWYMAKSHRDFLLCLHYVDIEVFLSEAHLRLL